MPYRHEVKVLLETILEEAARLAASADASPS